MLLKNFHIDFLLEKIGTFKKLHAYEVYVYVRVVLTRVDLYAVLELDGKLSCIPFRIDPHRGVIESWNEQVLLFSSCAAAAQALHSCEQKQFTGNFLKSQLASLVHYLEG